MELWVPALNEDPLKARELLLCEPFSSRDAKESSRVIANIVSLNQAEPAGFMKALKAARNDLHGLPFLLGNDCQVDVEYAQLFSTTARIVKAEMREVRFVFGDKDYERNATARLFQNLDEQLAPLEKEQGTDGAPLERATTAALMQILAPGPALHREFMAQRFAKKERLETTQALARLALFAPEDAVRAEAIKGLQGRPARDYKEILMQGFRYPLPAVWSRAAAALVKLECKDALADLIGVLERPDPQAPVQQKIDGKEAAVVRELVRVNHHRNCLLCHAPAQGAPADVLTARVPLSDQAFSISSSAYYGAPAQLAFAVRVDITYLRQDFSMMTRVEKARPWPEYQRFDFLVRTRVLTTEEAAECETLFAKQGTPPSHAAAQTAAANLPASSQRNRRRKPGGIC